MADEEEVEAEEPAPAGAEFVPEQSAKPRSDVFTLVLILTFVAFLGGCILSGREAWEHYDVQFWVFTKQGTKAPPPEAAPAATPVNVTDPGAPPAPPAPPPPGETPAPPKSP